MITYISISIIIAMMGLYFELINSTAKLSNRKKLPNYFFAIPSFLLLLFISSFRGDFTTDYKNYVHLFELYNRFDFLETFQVGFAQEIGYVFLSRLIGIFTDDPVYLFAIVSLIILIGFYSQINKYSSYIWLSVLMFVTIGSFYTSFNIVRQILAVTIIFAGSKFLYERKPIKYLLLVILASLFHKTALIMIVFYFILNLKFRLRNLVFIFSTLIISSLYLDKIIAFIQRFFYTIYSDGWYGMTGVSFTNALLPIALVIFTLLNYKKIDLHNNTHRIWLNAVIFYAFFSILGLQIQMVQRLSGFFAPYVLLLIPLLFSKMKHKELRVIYMLGLVFLLILYNYITLSGTGYDPYYFIWDTH